MKPPRLRFGGNSESHWASAVVISGKIISKVRTQQSPANALHVSAHLNVSLSFQESSANAGPTWVSETAEGGPQWSPVAWAQESGNRLVSAHPKS